MKIGIIGIGPIGSTLVRQYTKAGHQVKMANASNIGRIKELQIETGAQRVPLPEIVEDIAVLVVSIPLMNIPDLAKTLKGSIEDDTVVVDTTNYYPIRDGHIAEIVGGMPESIWISNYLGKRVVKTYNSLLAGSLVRAGLPKGAPDRIALPISGDDPSEKEKVAGLVDDSGFDSLDIGDLENSWRQQPGSPIYCTDLTLSQLKGNLPNVRRELLPERLELSLQFILEQDPAQWLDWWKDCVANNRAVNETDMNE